MRYRITAPVANHRGDLAGLIFRDGVAEADSESDFAALEYCRRRGYTVEPAASAVVEEAAPEQDDGGAIERPADYAAKSDWVVFAVSRGASEEDAKNATKNDLIELYG